MNYILSKEQFSAECELYWSITNDNPTMNQWESKADTRDRRKARENAGEKMRLILIFHLIGWIGGANFFNQSQNAVKENQTK